MIRITKVIVNGNRSLIGFVVAGPEKEFGGFSSSEVQRSIPIGNIIKDRFSNNQIAIENGKIVEKGNFRINSLPMAVYIADTDELIDIDNRVNITGRFVQNNENIGFEVEFADGTKDNLKYENVILICKWFKPGNFAIRTSSKGKQYICSKNGGLKLDELPSKVLGKESKAKRTKSAAKEKKESFGGELESGLDIIDIYDFIKGCKGCIIYLPSEKYVATTEGGEKVVENFTPLGIGEVASATPNFNATKINVNADFKKVGIVPVEIAGNITNITTFIYRKKTIFMGGDSYSRFAIAVPKEKEDELIARLGASLALKKITDTGITQPLGQVIDAKSLVFYTINTDKIDLISESKRKASVLSATKLRDICTKMYSYKLISKAMGPKGGLMKEIKNALGETTLNNELAKVHKKKLFGIFSMMNDEALSKIQGAGIDIYTGAYTVPGTPVKKDPTKKDADSKYLSDVVEIEYILKGYEQDKITGKKVIEFSKANDATKIPQSVIDKVNSVLANTDLITQYIEAKKIYDQAEAKIAELNKTLWLHNASMYIEGGRSNIHTHDSKFWVPDANSRVKKGKVYMCTAKGAEGLTIKFNNIAI